ncbi:MAG TPA: rhomboid family intramembrane serine protease [Blastocatellia bacterium]|nr:rhomboid family intramembrane serine protease [Blastocatellia bacterium]
MTLEKIRNEPAFRDCPACGNPTPLERADCIYCGHKSVEALVAEQEAARASSFIDALFARSNPFTMIFIGINLGVFALEWLAGGMGSLSADIMVLRAMGAKDNPLINTQHEYWRFITSNFLHIGFLHLLFNNYALMIIGQEIERIYGSARFVILYIVTGIVASMASYYFNPEVTSAGASGSIFGLFGVMAAFGFKYRKELPEFLSKNIKRQIIPVIIINLAFGFIVRIVDNSAHIGGLLSGIALAFIIPYKRLDEKKTAGAWRSLQIICLAVALISFVAAFRNYDGPELKFANLGRNPQTSIRGYVAQANKALIDSINFFIPSLNKRDERADTSTALEAAERGIKLLENSPDTEDQMDTLRQLVMNLLIRQKQLIERFNQMNPKDWEKIGSEEEALIKEAKQNGLIQMEKEADNESGV